MFKFLRQRPKTGTIIRMVQPAGTVSNRLLTLILVVCTISAISSAANFLAALQRREPDPAVAARTLAVESRLKLVEAYQAGCKTRDAKLDSKIDAMNKFCDRVMAIIDPPKAKK